MSAPIKTLTLFKGEARTALPASADQNNFNYSACVVVVDVTAVGTGGNAPSLTFTVQGKDLTSGKYYDIATTGAVTAVGTKVIEICPDITAGSVAAGTGKTRASVSAILPKTWRVEVTGTAGTATYSVGAQLADC